MLGGLSFHRGRVVEELGDTDDVGICLAACESLGYGDENDSHSYYLFHQGRLLILRACILDDTTLPLLDRHY